MGRVYFPSLATFSSIHTKEENGSAPPVWKGCHLQEVRVDVGFFGLGYFIGLSVSHLYAFYRDILCKSSVLEAAPTSKNINFFSLRAQWNPLFLSWLEMKGKASKCFKSSDVFSLEGIIRKMKAGRIVIEVYKVMKGLSRVSIDMLTKSLKARAKGNALKLQGLTHCT